MKSHYSKTLPYTLDGKGGNPIVTKIEPSRARSTQAQAYDALVGDALIENVYYAKVPESTQSREDPDNDSFASNSPTHDLEEEDGNPIVTKIEPSKARSTQAQAHDAPIGYTLIENVHNAKVPESTQEQNEPDYEPITQEISSIESEEFYEYFLGRALNNAGICAYGIMAIEVWVLNKNDDMIKCETGGRWRDPVFTNCEGHISSLSFLEDPSLDGYVPPKPVKRSEGFIGAVFEEEKANVLKVAKWHDLRQMVNDVEFGCERTLVQANVFGRAMAIYFEHSVTGTEGIVMFFARHSAPVKKLSNRSNHMYLCATTNLLGSIVSWKEPKVQSMKKTREITKKAWSKVIFKLKSNAAFSAAGRRKAMIWTKIVDYSGGLLFINAYTYLKNYVSKFKGGDFMSPPGTNISQTIFVFLGCVSSLLSVSLINEAIKNTSNDKLFIILGPLGALLTCHYALTSAPATQPRNAVGGLILSSVVAIGSTYIPVTIIPIWLRVALVPALTTTATLRLGIVHPPAGSMAVLFAMQDEADWISFLLLVLGYVLAIMYAILFVNLYEGRIFPMYW